MANETFLKNFYAWRKAAGTLLRDGREKRGESVEAFLAKTGQDHRVLQDAKIWTAMENGRIRSRTKNEGETVVLGVHDYVKAMQEYIDVHYHPGERAEEKTALRAVMDSQPKL